MRNAFGVLALTMGFAGCTLQNAAEIRDTFPATSKTTVMCVEYADYAEMTVGLRRQEQLGWKPRVIGFDHNYILWGLFLASDIVVCYEKLAVPAALEAPALPQTAQPQPAAPQPVQPQPAPVAGEGGASESEPD